MSGDTVTYSLEAILLRIEGKIDTLQKDVGDLKIGQTELKGDIISLVSLSGTPILVPLDARQLSRSIPTF